MLTRLRRSSRLVLVAAIATTTLTTATVVPAVATSTTALSYSAKGDPQVVTPDDDPFYDVPPRLDHKRDGTVLRARTLPAGALATPAPAQVWQLLYKTRDNAGKASATVGTLLVPTARWRGEGDRPLLSYQTPEDGLDTTCAPSYLLRAGSKTLDQASEGQANFDRGQVADAVKRGWAVIVSDYEGPRSQFLGATGTAAGVLDGIRAARNFGPAHVNHKSPIGLWGYSGAGYATTVTAQKQAEYAPELKISAIAAGGVIADLNAALHNAEDKPFSGLIPFAVAAMDRSYPDAKVYQYANEAGRAAADKVAHGCLGGAFAAGPQFAKISQFEESPGSLTSGTFRDIMHSTSPVGLSGNPTAPMYMYHGTADELLPISAARELYGQLKARGVDVVMTEHEGQSHFADQSFGVAGAVSFLQKHFEKAARR
ncbi:lipase family protein [Lentzea sp. NPDC058436]|uniref:lipase family protein n=1 Tax=Lentzea sp. NPDC058436 TaxID=3346499 RepID=UPI00364CFD17